MTVAYHLVEDSLRKSKLNSNSEIKDVSIFDFLSYKAYQLHAWKE